MGISLFSQVTAIEQEGMASSCIREGFGWILGNISFLSGDAVAQLFMELGGSLSLEGFQNHRDVALRDVGSAHGGGGLGLDCGI